MAVKDAFIAELKHEAALTRKMLERVPLDKKDWQPHEKSMSVGRLATHLTETLKWISTIRHFDDFDFTKDYNFKQLAAESQVDLLQLFQVNLDNAINDLSAMNDDDFRIRLLQIGYCFFRNVFVTGTMKPVVSDSVFIIKLFRNGDAVSNGRHGLMKSCIKYGHLFGTGEDLLSDFNP